MFEFPKHERVMLLVPDGMEDGEPRFREIGAEAVVLWSEEFFPGFPSRKGISAELLLKSPVPPEAGGRIRWRNRIFDLKQVRVCPGFDGEKFQYRCTLV